VRYLLGDGSHERLEVNAEGVGEINERDETGLGDTSGAPDDGRQVLLSFT